MEQVHPKITSSGKEVMASGTVTSFDTSDLKMTLSGLTFNFEFLDDDINKEARMVSELLSDNSLKVKFFNFNDPLGLGSKHPIPTGQIANRTLYISFLIYSHGKGLSKTFHYTFFLDQETNG